MQMNANAQRDLETLTALNRDFTASVQKRGVKRLEEILADDFMVSTPDGSLLDKVEFLKATAQPVTISGLVAEDVRIRLLGDFAIIHARFNSRRADSTQRRAVTPITMRAATAPGLPYRHTIISTSGTGRSDRWVTSGCLWTSLFK
jgi:hypothetical protein